MTTAAPVRVGLPATATDSVVIESDMIMAGSVPERVLAVYVEHDGARAAHPVQGRYDLRPPAVEFTPLFPFNAGQQYRIEVAGRPVRTFALASRPATAVPQVLGIFPTAPRIPVNALRLHIGFSHPMRRQRAHEYLRLLDDHGHDVTEIIVDLGQELWSPDSTRLTMLLDPGRAKRGIHAIVEPGPALTQGRRYHLVVKPGWPAATGAALTAGGGASFAIGPALRAPLDEHTWILSPPPASSRRPVLLDFGRTMDIATLSDRITIYHHDGHPVAGTVAVGPGERRWSFVPAQSWAAEPHRLVADVDLEDVAGNRVGEALDHQRPERRAIDDPVVLTFHPHNRGAGDGGQHPSACDHSPGVSRSNRRRASRPRRGRPGR